MQAIISMYFMNFSVSLRLITYKIYRIRHFLHHITFDDTTIMAQ